MTKGRKWTKRRNEARHLKDITLKESGLSQEKTSNTRSLLTNKCTAFFSDVASVVNEFSILRTGAVTLSAAAFSAMDAYSDQMRTPDQTHTPESIYTPSISAVVGTAGCLYAAYTLYSTVPKVMDKLPAVKKTGLEALEHIRYLTGGGTNPDSPESPQHNIFTDERVNAVGDLIISNLSQKGRKHIIDQINTNIPLHVQEELLDLLVKNKLTTAKTHEIFNGYAPGLLNEMQEQILSLDISHQKKILPIFVKDKNQQAALISVLQEAHKLKKSQSKDFQEYSPSYTVTEIPTLLQDEIKNLKGINATIDAVLPSVKSNIASDASKVVSGLSTASSGLLQAITSTQKLGTSVSPAVRGVLKTASGIKEAGSVVVSRVVSGANAAVRVLGETSVSDIVSKAPKILREASVSDVVSGVTKVVSVGYSAVACVGLMSGLSFAERMQNAKRGIEVQQVLKDLDKQLISKEDVKNLRRIISEHLPPKKAKEFVEEINKKMPVEQQEELLALLERGELTRGKVQNTFNRHAAGLLNLMQDEVISLPRKVQEKLLPYLVKTEDQQAALLNALQQAHELRKLPDSTTQMSKSENLTAQQRLEKQKDERQSFYVRAK